MRLPTLRQLHYLTVVTELKHFGKAAEQCFVTQSTLSAGIQELESLLGSPLLERTNRRVLVTPLGEEITKRAQHILSLSADLVDLAKFEHSPLSGRLRIGIIPSISPFLLPKALPAIRDQLSNIEFVLIEQQSEELIRQLHSGEIDLVVMAFPFDIGQLKHTIFGSESFWVALPKEHPLQYKDQIDPTELRSDELMLLSEGHCLREHALSACQLPPTSYRTTMQGTSLYTLIEMVAGGLGITLLPEMAINSDIVKHADITIKPLLNREGKAMRELGLVWRPSFKADDAIQQISQYFRDAVTQESYSV